MNVKIDNRITNKNKRVNLFTKIQESKWLKIVLFLTTFAFVGTGFVALIVYKFSGEIPGVAQVNGEDITQQEFIYEVNQIEAKYQNQGIDISPFRKMIYAQVLDSLINRQLLYQFAKEEGIEAKKEEVKQLILNIPSFQKDGKFSKDLFAAYLNSVGISPQLFEEILQKQLSVSHLISLLKAGFYITDYEVDSFLKRRLSSIDGKMVVVKPEVFISEKEMKEYFEKNKSRFLEKKGKKIKIYEIDVQEKDAQQKAQKLYINLKSKKLPEDMKPAFDITYTKDTKLDLPKKIINAIKELSNSSKIQFIKTKDKYYIIYFEGEKSIPISFEKAKPKIKKALQEEKIKEKLKVIKSEIQKQKIKDIKEIADKYKGTIEKFRNLKFAELQLKYSIPIEEVDKLIKQETTISNPLISGNKLIIIEIDKIHPPSKEEYKKAVKTLKIAIENQKINDIVQMLVNKLKSDADIKINKRVLQ